MPHRRRHPRLARSAAVALAVVALAACGNSAPTKSDVVARGDAICQTAFRDAHLAPPAGSGPDALAGYLAGLAPVVTREVDQLEALPRPAQDRSLLVAYLAALRASVAQYRALQAAAARGDETGIADAEARLEASPAADLAQRYGLTACAASGGTVGSS